MKECVDCDYYNKAYDECRYLRDNNSIDARCGEFFNIGYDYGGKIPIYDNQNINYICPVNKK